MAPMDGHNDGVANHHMVFIDTSLDTHLALIVSDSDTVSDFKRNIMLEHRQLFPAIGDVKIECLKVKRRGSFYKLSESMLVKSAFESAKGNWFVSVDASRLEQNDGGQQLGKHKDGDQLALPWVPHSRSIERHGNDGSPSDHSKTAPLVNQKVPIVDQLTSGDSCKDVSKNVKEDRLCNDKQLDYELQEKLDTANTDINSKKRTRDVHNECSLNDAFGSGPSVKKKRKTHRGKSDVKALEENLALRHDSDKVNDKDANVNNDNSFEHRSKGKKLSDENHGINKGENCSALDQVATVVPTIEGVGSETVGDVAMVVENNIQQEIAIGRSQKDTDSEAVQKPNMGDEPSSLMRTPDCEHGGAGVTDAGHMKRSTEHKAAEKEASSTSSPHVVTNEGILLPRSECPVNNDANISTIGKNTSQVNAQDLLDNLEKQDEKMDDTTKKKKKRKTKVSAGRNEDESITKHVNGDICDNLEKQDEKMDDTTKKKKNRKTKVSAGRNEDELITKHVDRDICESVKEGESVLADTDRTDVGMSSTVLASVIDETKMNEDLEKTLIDGKKGDDVIMKEVENSVENMEEKSRKEFTNANDAVTGTNEENLLPRSESPVTNDTDISTTGKNTNQENAQGLLDDNLEKQEEKMDDTTKKKKKRKTKVSAGRNEDESITKHVNHDICDNLEKQDEKMDGTTKRKKKRRIKESAGTNEDESITKLVNRDVCENVKEGESGLLDTDRTDGDMPSTVLASVIDERKMNEDLEKTLIDGKKGDDVIVKEVGISVENMEEKSRKEFTNANDVATGTSEENLLHLASVIDEKEMNKDLEKTLIDGKKGDDVTVKEVEISVDNAEERSRKELTNAKDVVTVTNEENLLLHSESLMNNALEISTTDKNTSQVNAQGMLDNSEKQNEKTDDTTKKKKKKKKKTKKSAGRNEDESVTKNVDGDIFENVEEGDRKDGDKVKEKDSQISYDGLAGKESKNNKSQDLQVQLESKKSQSVDHHHLPEKTSKNLTASEVSKVNNKVDIPETESRDLDFKDCYADGHLSKKIVSTDNTKDKKKTKVDSRNDQSQKVVSKIENNKFSVDVLKDPNITNIDNFKTPKRAKKIDAKKTNRQPATLVQTRAKTMENKKVKGSQPVKSLLNTPRTIFGNDSDSDSSTRTPSGKSSSSSSSSSSSGESSFSQYSRRSRSQARKGMEGAGKNNINLQNKSNDPILGKLLRSSSAFKKAKVTASSQGEDNVDIVPDSQP